MEGGLIRTHQHTCGWSQADCLRLSRPAGSSLGSFWGNISIIHHLLLVVGQKVSGLLLLGGQQSTVR